MPSIAERPADLTGAQITEVARRRARFRYATERLIKIAEGSPAFTAEELYELGEIFTSRAAERDNAA
jgi:hypothetical protein